VTTKAAAKEIYAKRSSVIQGALPFVALILVVLLFLGVTKGQLFAADNLRLIVGQVFSVMVIALGAQFVMAHGSFDLTIGGNVAVAMLVGSLVLRSTGNVALSFFVILVMAVAVAFINGGISSYFGLPAFLTSLVLMFILRGIMQYAASIEIVKLDGRYGVYDNYILKGAVLLVCIVVTWYLFNYTKVGKYNKLIGGNSTASSILGVPVARYKLLAYLVTGVTVAVAAFFAMCRERYISGGTAGGLEFDVIVALIFGGMPLAGGSRARFRAAIVGALIFTVLFNGMILWGLDTGVVALIRGVLFVVIVFVGFKRTRGPLPR
jgi:ribose transport system permease protein